MTGVRLTGLGLVSSLANDDVGRVLRFTGEVVLEDRLRTVGVASLGIECRATVVRYHTVTTANRVLHRAPDVVLGCGLHVPDVTRVTRELTRLEGRGDGVLVTDGTTRGVDEPCTLLEVLKEISVDEAASTLMERAVDGDDVALYDVVC